VYTAKVPSILPKVLELEGQPQPVVAFGRDYPAGHLVASHTHQRAQLIHASAGIMRIDTPIGIWIVPPMRAIWVPQLMPHEIRATSHVSLRTLFIRPGARHDLPSECVAVEVSPLLRELILRVVSLAEAEPPVAPSEALVDVVLSEIRESSALPLHIPMPSDSRARKICQSLLQNPADGRTGAQWSTAVGASARTLDRLFRKETGISFGAWRRQVRLLAAMTRLAAGAPIGNVAMDLGYESPSAFTAMFRRVLGHPPSQFFQSK
jgi:AraC-like DNA-binding protein